MSRPRLAPSVATAVLAVALSAFPVWLEGQDSASWRLSPAQLSRDADPLQQVAPDTAAPAVSPGGAFLRALVVPGWGHAAAGSYTRAGFYFVTSAATGWMLFKTAHSLEAAEARRDLAEEVAKARLEREGITEPDRVEARLEENPRVQSIRGLVEARSQQMEDWTAFGLFWLFLNAADAFVSAHLADFPEPVEIDVRSAPPGSRSELRISVPVGGS